MKNELLKHEFVIIMVIISIADKLTTEIGLLFLPLSFEGNDLFVASIKFNAIIGRIVFGIFSTVNVILLAMLIVWLMKIISNRVKEGSIYDFILILPYSLVTLCIAFFATMPFKWILATTICILTGSIEMNYYMVIFKTNTVIIIIFNLLIIIWGTFFLIALFLNRKFWIGDEKID